MINSIADLVKDHDQYRDGIVCLDEYQDIAGAYGFSSKKNRILASIWARIRKHGLNMAYTSKISGWVDTRTRGELDLLIDCRDVSKLPWGRGVYNKGQKALWTIQDVSGIWTGRKHEEDHHDYPYMAYLKPLWGSYPTDFSVDIWDSLRGFDVDLESFVISDKDESAKPTIDAGILRSKLIGMFESHKRIAPTQFWSMLGIQPNDVENRTQAFMVCTELGIERNANKQYVRNYDAITK